MTTERRMPDIGFYVKVAKLDTHTAHFVAYRCWDSEPTGEEYAVFLHGFVKSDGCSNWLFDEQGDNIMIHFCTKDDLENVGKLLGRLYDWAGEIIENWDG